MDRRGGMAAKVRHDGAAIAVTSLLAGILAGLGTMADAKGAVPAVTGDSRVDALLAQMTLDEKLSMVAGGTGGCVDERVRVRLPTRAFPGLGFRRCATPTGLRASPPNASRRE